MPTRITRRRVLAGLAGGAVFHSFPPQFAHRLLQSQTVIKPSELATLRRNLTGQLLLPSDRDYDTARKLASYEIPDVME